MPEPMNTATMLGVVEKKFKFQPFILSMFFPLEMTFDTKELHFDKIAQSGKMAPFISPMVAGKPVRKKGHVRQSVEPAYVKPKHIVDPSLPIKSIVGEAPTGNLTVVDRRRWWRSHLLSEQELMILRREEWMATQAVVNGSVVISGEEYATQHVDFGRSPENNITLVGASKWNTVDPSTYDPSEDFEDWALFASGPVNVAIMDKEAWRLFKGFKAVKDLLKRDSGSRTTMETGPKDLGMVASYKGTFGADLEIWVYTGKVQLDDDSYEPLLPAGTVLMGYDGYQGVRAYGAIMDAKAQDSGIVKAKRYPKNWFTEEPSVENLMTQSAPLMVTEDADGFVVIRI